MSQRVDKDSLPLDKPRRTPGHPTKSHIVKTRVDGKEKIIRFGEQGASTAGKPKEGESERMKAKRASFKSRHAKNIAKGKSSPAYWANKVKWADGGPVELLDMAAKYDEGGDVDIMDYLRSAGSTLSSLPEAPRAIYEAGKRAVQAAPEAARSALQYIQRSTPQEVAQDVTGGLTRAARYVRDNPVDVITDVIPFVGEAKQYGQDVARAAAMRARGDVRGAQEIERLAIPLAAASLIPGVGEARTAGRVANVVDEVDAVIPMARRKTNLDRFLKESIMKDEAGEPVMLFHGTSDDVKGNFNIYHPNRKDQGWLGRGAYVTDVPEMANMYASMKAGKEGPNVMPLYGDIRNPYEMTLEEKNKLRFLPQEAIDDFTYKLRDAGHDSAIVTYPDGTREIAVFNPERQLKSASGNRGTYDPENPDLKYAEGGLVDYDPTNVDMIVEGVHTGKYAQGGLVQYDTSKIDEMVNQIREGIYG
jgi:hypothetical protein